MKVSGFLIPSVLAVALLAASASMETLQGQSDSRAALASITDNETESTVLELPANLYVVDVRLEDALTKLQASSGVAVAYSPTLLPDDRLVTCECEDMTVAEATRTLLQGVALEFVTLADQLIIRERRAPTAQVVRTVRAPASIPSLSPDQAKVAGQFQPIQPAQEGTITGRVTDTRSMRPLPGVQISIEETEQGVLTDSDGRYTISEVPAGTVTLDVHLIGYARERRSITVPSGGTVTVDFELRSEAIGLEGLVVTATGERRRAEVANVIGRVDADALIESVPITNMAQLLTARSPGVQVSSVAGTVGGQSRIRIRGQNSMSLSNDPIVYVDGVRVASGYGGGMDTASRLDDLNPADIQSLDVLKGPAAVALYGTDAANGVILISTKRGALGPPQWDVFVETGLTEQPSGFPTAFYSAGHRTDTGSETQCLLSGIAAGTCVQDELRTLNLLEDPRSTPFAKGRLTQTGVQLSGGAEGLRYFVSADVTDEIGSLRMPIDEQERILTERGVPARSDQRRPNSLRAINFRTNVSVELSADADLDVAVGYTDRDHRFTTSGGSIIFGMMRNALQGRGFRDDLGGWWAYPAGDLFSVEEVAEVGRLIGSVSTTWRPATWLTTRARVGLDRVNEENSLLQRRDEGLRFSDYREGRKSEGWINQSNYTVELGATGTFDISPRVGLRSSLGTQYYRRTTQSVNASGTTLSPGTEHVGGTAVRSAGESNSGRANLGGFVEQVLGFDDRLFVTGSVRTDQNSAFGSDFDAVFYPRASISWVASEESFFPETSALSSLRLRLAYGMSGVSPGTLDALRYFTSVQTFEDGVAQPGLQFQAIGNVDLEPERTTEVEAGFDLELLEGRATVEATYYRKLSRDALINRPLAPSLGLNSLSRFENIGSVRNSGWEGMVDLQLLERQSWGWNVSLHASVNENELVRLGEGVTPASTFAGTRAEEGYPLWGRWARPILGWEDLNGDGIITPDEVEVGDEPVYLGPSTPTREGAISSGVTLMDGMVRIGALLDYRGGHLAYNRTEADRCVAAANCRAVNDPNAPLWEQARAVAASTPALGSTHAGYFEDGAYTTLREISLSVQVPQRLSRFIGASGATATVAGRNLHTWTDYSGISPEGSWVDNMGLDMNLVPSSRYWTIRVNANY